MEKYTCWSPVVSMWIIFSYRGIQLFVWLFMCEIREHTRHETVMKRTLGMMMMMNALISHNYTASGRAPLMNYVYDLNFANCELWSLSVRFVIKLQYTFICSNKSSPVGRVLSVKFHLFIILCSFLNLHNMYRVFFQYASIIYW